jgi:glutathione peroxidase
MMNRPIGFLLLVSVLLACASCEQEGPQAEEPATSSVESADETISQVSGAPIYQFEMTNIDGTPVNLGTYSGKVLLLVNVASKCGYTPQYAGLQQLYEKYGDQDLVVLGFPANNFGSQEPGTEEEIQAFCTTNYNVTFPMFSKISVKGDGIHPLYAYLTSAESDPQFSGPITWNFNKFLIGRDGSVIGRYDSKVEPLSAQLAGDIEGALAKEAG